MIKKYLEHLKTYKTIPKERLDELAEYCLANPRYAGLFISGGILSTSKRRQIIKITSLFRKEIHVRTKRGLEYPRINLSEVLIDARLDNSKHVGLWLPVAYQLAQEGMRVGLVSNKRSLGIDVNEWPDLQDQSWFELLSILDGYQKEHKPFIRLLKMHLSKIPWKGLFGLSMALQEIYTDRLIDVWMNVLQGSGVKLVLVSSPTAFQSSAFLYASKCSGIKTMQLTQGLPLITWQFPTSDLAVVWSKLGETLLLKHGWTNEYRIAKNPTIPLPESRQEIRVARRKQLGFGEMDFCVLFLGGKSTDKGFPGEGYLETCDLVGKGLSLALKSWGFVPMLRPHYNEPVPETEQVLSKHLQRLLISKEPSLVKDVVAADVVLSMYSGALEEAYLMGQPIIQVVAPGVELLLDFQVVGAPLARTREELADLLLERQWIDTQEPPVFRSVAEEIIDLVAH